jgi:hypothetical protein
MLAQQGQLQDIQLQQARNELAMQPQKLEEARRAKEAKYMQDVAREIAASPEQKDMILNRHAELAPQFGIDPNHITWLAADLANSQNVQDRALYHADPQEYMKKQLEAKFRKPLDPSWQKIEEDGRQIIVNANDPNAQKVFGAKPKQDNTLVAVIGPDGQTPILVQRSQAAGMTPAGGKGAASPTQHIADAKESNALLDQVEKVGDLATGSGLGKMRDISAGFFGQSTEGANNAAKLKVLGASLTAKVPKMSGPQSDKDVAMYKEAAGSIADPSIPWAQKKAAIATIREINNRQLSYGNDISNTPSAATNKGVPVVSKTKTGATTSGW